MTRDDGYWRHRVDRPGAPAIPILAKRMRRIFWCPPRYRGVMGAALATPRATLRDLAARTRYSVTGIRHALESLRAMGLIGFVSTRGRHGSTRISVSSDATMGANVPPTKSTTPGLSTSNDLTVGLWGAHLPSDPLGAPA